MANIILSKSKYTHINFINKKINPVPIEINKSILPYANIAKYLGTMFGIKLTWKKNIMKKEDEFYRNSEDCHLVSKNFVLVVGEQLRA